MVCTVPIFCFGYSPLEFKLQNDLICYVQNKMYVTWLAKLKHTCHHDKPIYKENPVRLG